MGRLTLILGGARSGKSRLAQDTALSAGQAVLFVATGEALDREMLERIEEHRRTRPAGWRTLEAPCDAGRRIRREAGDARAIIVDCLTLLVSNVIGRCGPAEEVDAALASVAVAEEIRGLVSCIEEEPASFIVVSNEVGLGLVPDNRLGRIYRDCLGRANAELAQRAETVYLMVAGIPMVLKGGP